MFRLSSNFTAKKALSTALSTTMSLLMAFPAQSLAQAQVDLSADKYVITFQPKGNRRIIFRDENGRFLGHSASEAPMDVEVSGDVIRNSIVNGKPSTRKIISSLPSRTDMDGNPYMHMYLQRATMTAEGKKIPPGTRVLLDMKYFLNEEVEPAGATGTDNEVANEFTDSVMENARRNPPTEPMIEESDVEESTSTVIDEESFEISDSVTTFARGGNFPTKFLSAPTCSCVAGCHKTADYGPRPRPVTGSRWVGKGKKRRKVRSYGSAFHKALDIGGKGRSGSKIVAAADGIVKFRGLAAGGYGVQVLIDHGNGYMTQYAHLQNGSIPSNVSNGMPVKRGQQIGLMGSTGNSSGPHLHFGLWKDLQSVNPSSSLLFDPASPATLNRACSDQPEYAAVDQAMDDALRGALRAGPQSSGGYVARSTSAQ